MALPPCFPKIMHLLFLLSYALVIFNAPVHADPPYNYCRDANDGAENAIFRNNVNNLLLSLSSNASVNKFYKASAGDYPSKAYRLVLCINYVSHQDCNSCIAMASQAITALCSNSTDATVWEELCQLRLTEVAASNSSAHMYATKRVAFSDKENIYSLVQCTPDLSPEDCNLCLQAAIVEVLAGYQYRRARLLSRSCYVRKRQELLLNLLIWLHMEADNQARQMWSQDNGLELMDHLLIDDDSCRPDDFFRCVHIGLLCVQEDAFERPTMSSVMNMLKSETVVFGPPKLPAFSVGRFTDHYEPSSPNVQCENSTVSDFSAQ
ncbi:hypothetical protein Ancab_005321 [Ancistrocladus abbreviatus]